MTAIPYNVTIDLKGNNSKIEKIVATVGDSKSIQLNISVIVDTIPFDMTGHTAKITFTKADDTDVVDDLVIDDPVNGKLSYLVKNQAFSYPGQIKAEIEIFDATDGRLSSNSFCFTARKGQLDGTTIISTDEFSTLTTMISTVSNFDSRITANANNISSIQTQVTSMGNASPKGVYSSYAALNTAFPFGNSGIYIVQGSNGTQEVDTLNVTAIPTAAGNITVTLNGVATIVAVDPATDTTSAAVATKIRNATYSGWTTGGTGSTVTFTKNTVGTNTAPVLNAGTTGMTGTTAVTTAGTPTTTPDWYYYNGSAWIDGGVFQGMVLGDNTVTTSKYVNKSVTIEKTAFMESNNPNLFNKDTVTLGQGINTDGSISAITDYVLSDFIEVEPSTQYTGKYIANRNYYDANQIRISTETYSAGKTLTTPANAKFIRYTFLNNYGGDPNRSLTEMFVKGSAVPSIYAPYGLVTATFKNLVFADDIFDIFPPLPPRTTNDISNGAVTPAKTNFLETVFTNLFNKDTVTVGKGIDGSGNIVDFTDYVLSDYIPVEGSTVYTSKYISNHNYYDASQVFISTESYSVGKTITSPANARFIRYGMLNNYGGDADRKASEMFVKGATLPSSYVAFGSPVSSFTNNILIPAQVSKLLDKKWNVLGDSITFGVGTTKQYHQFIAERTGCIVTNYGISSSTVADNPIYTWVTNPMVNRYINMPDDADIISILGGVNDSNKAVFGDINSTDISTFYGAYNVMLEGLIKKYPTKFIFTMTPLQADDTTNGIHRDAVKLEQVAQAVREVSAKYGVPCLDLHGTSGFSIVNEQITLYTADKLHPNVTFHEKMSKQIENFILAYF